MDDFISRLIEQNEKIIALLEGVSKKLDFLDDANSSITNIETSLSSIESQIDGIDTSLSSVDEFKISVALDVQQIKFSIASVQDNLVWTEEASAAGQVLRALDNISDILVAGK